MLDYGLEGRVILITGAASGIGRSVALLAARSRASLILTDVSSTGLRDVAAEINASGGMAIPRTLDVRDACAIEAALDEAEARFGPVDGLVAAAGIGGPAAAAAMPELIWNEVVEVNMTGMFRTVQTVGRRMIERRFGAIVTIGSTSAIGGTESRAHYCASKHGVAGMTKALAIEWGPQGVRINCVAPGPVDTPLLRKHWPAARIERVIVDRIPLRRLATGEDQAHVCLFLLSDGAAYVTGVVLPVNGGLTAGFMTHLSSDGDDE